MKGFKSENTMLRNPENGYIYKIETQRSGFDFERKNKAVGLRNRTRAIA